MRNRRTSADQGLASAVEALQADRRSGASALSRQLAAALKAWAQDAPATARHEFLAGLRAAARRLAAIAAATVLCGELSLMAAQTNPGELMAAHLRLERP